MKMTTMAREEGVVPETRLEDEIDALEKEVEQLGREMTRELARVAAGEEERTSGEKRKRTEPIDRSTEKALPRLPTEVWAEVAAKIHRDDVMAFASISKQLRKAQQQADRKLVTRLYVRDEKVTVSSALLGGEYVYFSRDWCAWWIKRFNTSETEGECMKSVKSVINVAAHHGYVDVLESDIPEEKKLLLVDARTCACAAVGGHLETLQWLRSQGCPWDERACAFAALDGHFEILKWLKSEGCPWYTGLICCDAARAGHFEMLKWLRSEGCSWDEDVSSWAAGNGHLDMVKYLHENGCPWDEVACLSSAEGGHLDVLKYLHENGCPWDGRAWRASAESTIEYLEENGCPQYFDFAELRRRRNERY